MTVDKSRWQVWRFDQMAVNVNDRIDNPAGAGVEHYVGLEHLDTDSLKIRRWGVPTDVEATKLCFRKGDIIFGRRRAYQRKLAVADFDGICSAHAMVLRARTDVVLPEFLPFFMQSDLFMNRALEISVGSLSPTINWKMLAAQEFALPPLEEQRQLCGVLSNASIVIEELTEAWAKAKRLEETWFYSMLRGEGLLDASGVHQTQFGLTPIDWPLMRISQIGEVAYGISAAVSDNNDPSIGWPILTGANITLDGTIALDKIVYHPPPHKPDFILQKGDILLNWRSGSQEHVGKAAIFDFVGDWTFASFILRIRPNNAVNNLYLWRMLNHMRQYRLFGRSTSQQINFKMNASYFRDVEVIVPPLSVQNYIVDSLKVVWQVQQSLLARTEKVRDILHTVLSMIEGA